MSVYRPHAGQAPTPRETQVAIALLFGHCAKRTARNLGMGIQAVNACRYRLYQKFGVHSASELSVVLMRRSPQ